MGKEKIPKPTTFEYNPDNYVSFERKLYDAVEKPAKKIGKLIKNVGWGVYAPIAGIVFGPRTIRRIANKQSLLNNENNNFFDGGNGTNIGVLIDIFAGAAYIGALGDNVLPQYLQNLPVGEILIGTNLFSAAVELGRLKQSVLEHRVLKQLKSQNNS